METPSVLDYLKEKARALMQPINPAQAATVQDGNASASQIEAGALLQLEVISQSSQALQPGANSARVEIRAEIPAGTDRNFSITAEADGQVVVSEKSLKANDASMARPAPQVKKETAASGIPWPQMGAAFSSQTNAKALAWLRAHEAWVFGGAALLAALILVAWRLEDFPIYFFSDEAYQVLFAETLIKNNFLAANPQGIPIYIEAAGNRWTPMISTYFHAITLLLFGKSIFVTRLTTGLVGLGGMIAAGFALKEIFQSKLWWLAPLVALGMPAWLLHARTGFETVMSTGFYGGFALFYLLYRYKSPDYIYGALAFGAAMFYSYSNAQAIMAAAGLMLFFSDIRYHWQNRATLLRGLVFGLLLAVPLILFRIKEPGAIGEHLRTVNSFIVQDIPLTEKIARYVQNYAYGLSPQYWFIPNTHDLIRHRMEGMGQIATWMLPLFLIGLGVAVFNIRQPAYRSVLLLGLATPTGAATLDITITRVLPFVVPATIFIVLGLDWLRERFLAKTPLAAFSAGALLIFGLAGGLTLRTALNEGAYWTSDYGLYGLQFGAKQIFADALPDYLRANPTARALVSPSWANGADHFVRFFIHPQEQSRVLMTGVETLLSNKLDLSPSDLIVLPAPEYLKVLESGKFKQIATEKIIPYPNGQPGFYLLHLAYADNIDAILAAEKEALRQPIEGEVEIDGQVVKITYARIDMGQPKDLFDGDFFSLMRGAEANPYFMTFTFPQPRPISGLTLDLATMDYEVIVDLYSPNSDTPRTYTARGENVTTDAHVEMTFDNAPDAVTRVGISIRNLRTGDYANVHIRELTFLP